MLACLLACVCVCARARSSVQEAVTRQPDNAADWEKVLSPSRSLVLSLVLALSPSRSLALSLSDFPSSLSSHLSPPAPLLSFSLSLSLPLSLPPLSSIAARTWHQLCVGSAPLGFMYAYPRLGHVDYTQFNGASLCLCLHLSLFHRIQLLMPLVGVCECVCARARRAARGLRGNSGRR